MQKMKKLFYLMAFISLSMFNACSDDNDQPLIPAEKINGTYDGSSETSTLALTYGGEPLIGVMSVFKRPIIKRQV